MLSRAPSSCRYRRARSRSAPTTVSFFSPASWATSFGGRSNEMSASPPSAPYDLRPREPCRSPAGFRRRPSQSSKLIDHFLSGRHLSIKPPPASLFFSHSIAPGPCRWHADLAAPELITAGTGTPISGSVNLSRRRKSMRKVVVDRDDCSGFRATRRASGKRKPADRDRAVERPFDIVRGDRGAVVEPGRAAAETRRHRRADPMPRRAPVDLRIVVVVDAAGRRASSRR